jgi:hypothetical protein
MPLSASPLTIGTERISIKEVIRERTACAFENGNRNRSSGVARKSERDFSKKNESSKRAYY